MHLKRVEMTLADIPKRAYNLLTVASCTPIPVWAGMSMNDTATHYGAAIRYWCEETYEFPDRTTSRETTCTYRGVWSPNVIECIG